MPGTTITWEFDKTSNQAVMSVANFGLTNAMTNNFFGSGVANGSGLNPLYSLGGPRNFQFALKLFFSTTMGSERWREANYQSAADLVSEMEKPIEN